MPPRTKPAKKTAYANGFVAATMVLVLAALSLITEPPTPPSIAEFSPQAQQQIEQAPEEESAETGASGAAGARETIILEEEAAAAAAEESRGTKVILDSAPSALQCVTWPDGSVTQTFDPQSPPCIATWDSQAGNGGATSFGVTETEIRVAIRWAGETDEAFVEHVNRSYQLYGRRIVITPFDNAAGGGTSSPEHGQADAEALHELQAFAYAGGSDSVHVRQAVAQKKILFIGQRNTATETQLAALHPYVWQYAAAHDRLQAAVGSLVCDHLGERPAQHTPDPTVGGQPRTFAIVQHESESGVNGPDLSNLVDRLTACGQQASQHAISSDTAVGVAQMSDLRNRGITTLIASGHPNLIGQIMDHATRSGYQPEWLGLGDSTQYREGAWQRSGNQNTSLFGIAAFNKWLGPGLEPWQTAMAQGGRPATVNEPPWTRDAYASILLLASGIQMAGPNLTPETFAAGLQGAQFPNPGAGAAPLWQASVGFNRDHSMVDDVGMFWFDPTERPDDTAGSVRTGGSSSGAYCYVGDGQRWPFMAMGDVDDLLFDAGAGC